jgi:hypothetical protein
MARVRFGCIVDWAGSILDHDVIVSTSFRQVWSQMFSENRFALFGIVLQ